MSHLLGLGQVHQAICLVFAGPSYLLGPLLLFPGCAGGATSPGSGWSITLPPGSRAHSGQAGSPPAQPGRDTSLPLPRAGVAAETAARRTTDMIDGKLQLSAMFS